MRGWAMKCPLSFLWQNEGVRRRKQPDMMLRVGVVSAFHLRAREVARDF